MNSGVCAAASFFSTSMKSGLSFAGSYTRIFLDMAHCLTGVGVMVILRPWGLSGVVMIVVGTKPARSSSSSAMTEKREDPKKVKGVGCGDCGSCGDFMMFSMTWWAVRMQFFRGAAFAAGMCTLGTSVLWPESGQSTDPTIPPWSPMVAEVHTL